MLKDLGILKRFTSPLWDHHGQVMCTLHMNTFSMHNFTCRNTSNRIICVQENSTSFSLAIKHFRHLQRLYTGEYCSIDYYLYAKQVQRYLRIHSTFHKLKHFSNIAKHFPMHTLLFLSHCRSISLFITISISVRSQRMALSTILLAEICLRYSSQRKKTHIFSTIHKITGFGCFRIVRTSKSTFEKFNLAIF